jgi:hypothetical protein
MGSSDSTLAKKDDTPQVGDIFWWSGGFGQECFLKVKQIDNIDGKPAYYLCFVAGKGEVVLSKNELIHGRQQYGGIFQPRLTEPELKPWKQLQDWRKDKEETVSLLVTTFAVMLRHSILDQKFCGSFDVQLGKGQLFIEEIQQKLDAEVCRPVGLILTNFSSVGNREVVYVMSQDTEEKK